MSVVYVPMPVPQGVSFTEWLQHFKAPRGRPPRDMLNEEVCEEVGQTSYNLLLARVRYEYDRRWGLVPENRQHLFTHYTGPAGWLRFEEG